MIPVAGTIAALAMIAYAREPRGETRHPGPLPFDFGDAPDHEPMDEEPLPVAPEENTGEEAERRPAAEAREYELRLEADGTLVGEVVKPEPEDPAPRVFASVQDLIDRIGDARHTLVITNGDGVDRAKLDEVETALRDRFKVRKVYRAPETPPEEGR
jgi:hypothetical protein